MVNLHSLRLSIYQDSWLCMCYISKKAHKTTSQQHWWNADINGDFAIKAALNSCAVCVFVYVCTKECYGIHSKVSSEFIEDDVLVITTRGWDSSGLKYIIHREYLNQSKTLFLCSSDINLNVTHRYTTLDTIQQDCMLTSIAKGL